jgi:F0F1-type ATP synthase assembly protein I
LPDEPEDERGLSPNAKALRRAMPYLDAVWRFVGAAGLGVVAGVLLDRRLHSSPAFTLTLLMVGLGVGFWAMYRSIVRAGSR